ncbi:40S ribosomal protein S11 isoform X1 [Stegostoma tigrinum]|uniref:40S ribosomal protein S11 isoform X1 n=1 Tax=Stegostoma tigrinum TaxID=3053191 RepID=UPI00202ACF2F|nr:40S ribosomal protein S11 isoform X1 [Stegostoma tigrinum]
MADNQTERAYQKQPTIFQNKKRALVGEGSKEKLPRYYRNVGLGFKTPREAIDGTYIDKKCPFTGNVSIRGRILTGVVTKMKMQRTIVIRRDYLHYIRKYNRFEKRHKNMSVHLSPCFRQPLAILCLMAFGYPGVSGGSMHSGSDPGTQANVLGAGIQIRQWQGCAERGQCDCGRVSASQ